MTVIVQRVFHLDFHILSSFAAGGECGVDFPGVRSSDGTGNVCCSSEYGVCGGSGCAFVANDMTMDKTNCCVSVIEKAGVMCSDSMAAPCMIESIGEFAPSCGG